MAILEDIIRENNALRKENLKLRGKNKMLKREHHGQVVLLDEARGVAERWRDMWLNYNEIYCAYDGCNTTLPWEEE